MGGKLRNEGQVLPLCADCVGVGSVGACARGLLCLSDFHWADGLCCDGRLLALALLLSGGGPDHAPRKGASAAGP